jgi:mRNA interferase RelE/StbE
MSWSVIFIKEAVNDLNNLDIQVRKRIIRKISWIEENFDKVTPLALTGEWQGFYKFRGGDWRIIYRTNWNEQKIIIHYIDRRDKVYD